MAERIVIVAPNWLGDAVMALPAIADVRRHYPDAHLTIAARAAVAPLFMMVEGVDAVETLPGRGGLAALTSWTADATTLASGSFDAALLLPNSFATAFTARRAGIPERWGFATDWRGRMLTRAIEKPCHPLHQAAYYQALTTALGINAGPLHASVRTNRPRARDLLHEIGLDPDEPFVVFAPGAAYGRAKQWLPERFSELASLILRERGWSVVLVGSAADRAACEDIAARVPQSGSRLNRVIDLSGKTDLASLAGVLALSHAVVSNDSGAMHLAGAAGAKVVAIFGATSEARTAPLPAGAEAPAAAVLTHPVFCRPCMLRECPIDHRCMRGIRADAAFAALPITNNQLPITNVIT
ncbi:MAG: lipopolysaccharide heptosyltransferase II [Acidobacteriota bacterium]|nr:lipopolysaccharide heptosyltransferase II [Acidobacteriota bacterium]